MLVGMLCSDFKGDAKTDSMSASGYNSDINSRKKPGIIMEAPLFVIRDFVLRKSRDRTGSDVSQIIYVKNPPLCTRWRWQVSRLKTMLNVP